VDTRNKIKTWEEITPALEQGGWNIVAGEFDPVTAACAARIEALAKPGIRLLALIERGSHPFLDAESRAILLAGLRGVDAVTIEPRVEWRAVAISAGAHIHEEAKAGVSQREFKRQVAARQRMGL
jgi:hypothetical protein